MKTLQEKYNQLEKEVYDDYYKLARQLNYDIKLGDDDEDGSISIVDEIMGGTYEVYIKQFNRGGSFIGENVDISHKEVYSFDNISSLSNQIFTINKLQELIDNENE